MNAARRKELRRAAALVREALDIVTVCEEEEREGFDNLPEGLQESERGERMGECVDWLDEQVDALGIAADELENSEF